MKRTSETHPIRVDFLKSEEFPVLNNLGLTFAPGKKQSDAASGEWDRDLTADLTRLRGEYRIDTLVSLVEDKELRDLGIEQIERECRYQNIEIIRFPLRDVSVPLSLKTFSELIELIVKRLEQNKRVVIHCKGGLGRAGLTGACSAAAATNNQIEGSEAIKIIRAARGASAVETSEQEKFVAFFAEYWELYKESSSENEKDDTQIAENDLSSDSHEPDKSKPSL